MMMSAKEKRDLIETLLNKCFTEMNKLLKIKINAFKEEYIEHQNLLKIKEGVLETKKDLYTQLKSNNTKTAKRKKKN